MTRAGAALLAVLIAGSAGLAEAEVNPFWKELGGSASEKGISNTPDDGRDALDPSVAVGADGRPVVVYTEGFGGTGGFGSIVVKRWTGSAWQTLSGTAGIGHGRTPQIRISSTGTHYVDGYGRTASPPRPTSICCVERHRGPVGSRWPARTPPAVSPR